MGSPLTTVIAEDRIERSLLRQLTENLGHTVLAMAHSGQELVDVVIQHKPGLVITDIKLKGMDGLLATRTFLKVHQVPVIVVSGLADHPTIERASSCQVQAYLPKPVAEPMLAAAIAIASKRFREMQNLLEEVQTTRRRLADRIYVEKAKGVLMRRSLIDEATAYQKLRALARSSGQTLGLIAQGLLLAEESLSGLDCKATGSADINLSVNS